MKMLNNVKRVLKKIDSKFSYGIYKDSFEDFYKYLDLNNIDYVVLRWFDAYPYISIDEDVDILVSDESYNRLKKMCKRGRPKLLSFIAFDIYSVTNIDKHMSYYPPHLANKILQSKVRHPSGFMVPNDFYHFLSLCYHALFHKGKNSGLSSSFHETHSSKHNFKNYLFKLSQLNDLNYSYDDFTIEGIHSILKEHKFTPPVDIYFRRLPKNEILNHFLPEMLSTSDYYNSGLTVFILREVINTDYYKNQLLKLFSKYNLSVKSSHLLDYNTSIEFYNNSRGGDWGGRSLSSNWGGYPAYVYVVKDYTMDSNIAESYPVGHVCYDNIKLIKAEFRDFVNIQVKKTLRCHVLHTSDNGIEASEYIRLLNIK